VDGGPLSLSLSLSLSPGQGTGKDWEGGHVLITFENLDIKGSSILPMLHLMSINMPHNI
jgi:hypothetical protein